MKKIILPSFIIAIVLSSCSSAYNTSQTPDDVYYSPGRVNSSGGDEYVNYESSEDRYLRMKAHNYEVWSSLDDYAYWNDSRYDFGYSCTPSRIGFIGSFSPFYYYSFNPFINYRYYYTPWGGYYNPHYTIVYYNSPRIFNVTSSKTNLSAFRNNFYSNANNQPQKFSSLVNRVFTNRQYTPTNTNTNNNNNNSSRTFKISPSNNTGGRSGGFQSSGGSAGGSRPIRPH